MSIHAHGVCHKMQITVDQTTENTHGALAAGTHYQFQIGDNAAPNVNLAEFLGHKVTIQWHYEIVCVGCGAYTPKSYSQGYCYKCLISKAECDMCMLKPETCHHHLGTCREESFAQSVCMQPHIVYLANSSGLKVGITRKTQIPTRWLDQGATQALPIVEVPTRRLSGMVEVLLAQSIADKTNWREMLKGEAKPMDLIAQRDALFAQYMPELQKLEAENGVGFTYLIDELPRQFYYPVHTYANKISSLNLDKTGQVDGILQGIKGQYLLLDTGVINLRKYTGYVLSVQVEA